jgi:iron complex outermembrane receptor protein
MDRLKPLLSGIAASMILHISQRPRAKTAPLQIMKASHRRTLLLLARSGKTTLQSSLALTAITADALKQSNINQLIDLNGFVPGLTVANSGSFVRVVSIRGVGYEATDNLSAQPGTAFHIDGVYVASPYALQQDFSTFNA